MKAKLILADRRSVDQWSFADLVVWQVPRSVRGSSHLFKYRLAYVVRDTCVVRYDNEVGKGDHKHIGEREEPYAFTTIETLLADFWTDVGRAGS